MKVLVLGSAGLVGVPAVIPGLEPYHQLRLADLKPHPPEIEARHETCIVDVSRPEQVEAAAAGMEAIVNCTVVRDHPVHAFDVNIRGAFNVMRAAVRHGIKRVVHTGPQVSYAYRDDFDLSPDAPPRPGVGLYSLTKYVALEFCRSFAEAHSLEVVCLLFSTFVDPATDQRPRGQDTHSFQVTWRDAGQAFHRALVAEKLPSSFEVFNILSNLPHGRFSLTKARHLLGYEPQDDLAWLWTRQGEW